MKRREFITLLGGAAATWPVAARAQQPAMPVIVFLHPGAAEIGARDVAAFRRGLQDTGYIEGQNVNVEYHWLEGQYGRLQAVMVDLIRRPVAVIAIPGSVVAARAAKAATSTTPIVFQIGDDPVQAGLVAGLARPGGNATGVTSLNVEITPKRLRLLHELVPKAARVAVLVNPANSTATESALRDLHEAAPIIGLQLQVLKATSIAEIDAAFATLARERPDALFVGPDGFLRHPPCAICDPGRTRKDTGGLHAAGLCRSRRADELWKRPSRNDFVRLAPIPAASSRVLSPPICQCCSRRSSSSSSTSKQLGHSESTYLQGCSRSLTR